MDNTQHPQYYFCNATIRPNCLHTTNLCCLICECVEECGLKAEKIKPCRPNGSDEEEDVPCQFLI
jgi:hypothetical protein